MIDCNPPKKKEDCCVPHIATKPNPCKKPKFFRRRACPCDPCADPAVMFKTTNIPATLGTSEEGQPYAPKNGMYHNMLVRYEADGAVVLYDSVGVYTILKEGNTNA